MIIRNGMSSPSGGISSSVSPFDHGGDRIGFAVLRHFDGQVITAGGPGAVHRVALAHHAGRAGRGSIGIQGQRHVHRVEHAGTEHGHAELHRLALGGILDFPNLGHHRVLDDLYVELPGARVAQFGRLAAGLQQARTEQHDPEHRDRQEVVFHGRAAPRPVE
jgi:hypothetical protein